MFLLKTFFKSEYQELLHFQEKELEAKKMEIAQKNDKEQKDEKHRQYMINNGQELSNRLYRAIGNTIVIAIDGRGSHEYEYVLEKYHISIPYSTLVLDLIRKDDRYTIRKKVSCIEIHDSLKSGTTYCSKVHLTLDGDATRLYINWDKTIEIPKENEYMQLTKEYPYEKYTGLKFYMEQCKYCNRKLKLINEKYDIDKTGANFGMLQIENENGSGRIHVFTENIKYETGFIEYQCTNMDGEKCIKIIDTVQGPQLDEKEKYGNLFESTRRCGHGKASMKLLIQYAEESGVTFLYGELSSSDATNDNEKEWRNGYYKKMGFEIDRNKITRYITVS